MNNEQTLVVESAWTGKQRTILFTIIVLCLLVTLFILFVLPVLKPHYDPVPVYQTIGLPADNNFQFTISPNDQWMVYLDEVYPYYDRHNIVAYSISNDKKWTITLNERDSQLIRFGLSNSCWTVDSKYCVLKNEVSGYIDFSEPEPKFLSGKINYNTLACSDCEPSSNSDYFTDMPYDSKEQFVSPNGKFIAEAISYGTGFVSPPKLYVTDTEKNSKVFVANNVYYDMHFTSDSKRLYYYGCRHGGACDKYKDHLFYIDLEENTPHRSLEPYDKNVDPGLYYPQHSTEDEIADLDAIYQKETDLETATLRAHYDLFVETFKQPQKVIGLQGDRLVTEDYYQLALSWGVDLPDDKDVALSNLVETLIGQEVTVVMPPYEEFLKTYEGASKYDYAVAGKTLWIHDGNGKEIKTVPTATDPMYKEYIGIVNADVYYKGELLNDRYR